MEKPNIESVLIGQLAKGRGCTIDDVQIELEQTGGIDSLEGLELAVEAERTFGISISDNELSEACRSIPDLARLVRSKIRLDGKEGSEKCRNDE